MTAFKSRLMLGDPDPKHIASDNAFVKELGGLAGSVTSAAYTVPDRHASLLGTLRIGNLRFVEICTDPVSWTTAPSPQWSVIVPIRGCGAVSDGTSWMRWQAPRQLVTLSHTLPLRIDCDRCHVIEIMPLCVVADDGPWAVPAAVDGAAPNGEGCRTAVRAGIINGVDYANNLRLLFSIIGQGRGDAAFLGRLGIDDVIIRMLAEMFAWEADPESERPAPSSLPRSEAAVEIICDHIVNNVGRPLTVAGMEQLTGLSGRSLNYAFQARFNCSPLAWQRNHMLDLARIRLCSSDKCLSVKQVAYELGFSFPSSLARHYKRRFGTFPNHGRLRRDWV